MKTEIITLCVGPLDVNCYIVGCDEHKLCAVIDPGDSSGRILSTVDEKGWKVSKIINTHGHADHTGANGKVKDATNAPLLIHKSDEYLLSHPDMHDMAAYIGVGKSPDADSLLKDGDDIEVCPCLSLTVLATPGHTKGGICLTFEDKVITGDTIFRLSIGRTDLLGGNTDTLLESIKTKLFALPDETCVYPGHGDTTTIGLEKSSNPFLAGTFR